jgi:hypothetical protein
MGYSSDASVVWETVILWTTVIPKSIGESQEEATTVNTEAYALELGFRV